MVTMVFTSWWRLMLKIRYPTNFTYCPYRKNLPSRSTQERTAPWHGQPAVLRAYLRTSWHWLRSRLSENWQGDCSSAYIALSDRNLPPLCPTSAGDATSTWFNDDCRLPPVINRPHVHPTTQPRLLTTYPGNRTRSDAWDGEIFPEPSGVPKVHCRVRGSQETVCHHRGNCFPSPNQGPIDRVWNIHGPGYK